MKFNKIFIIIIFLFISIFGVYFFIEHVISAAEPTSMFYKLQEVNIQLFIKSFSGCMLAFAVYFATIPHVLSMINPSISVKFMRKFLFFTSKLFITLSFIFSLLVSLTEDQFTVVSGVISFFALFSFILPKGISKHFKNFTEELNDKDTD
ncbi:hypothetical protein C240_2280 [Enterococcus sp. 5H]|nr:hypothetical protein [Enterococcus sp. 5H]